MDCSTPGFPVLHYPGVCSNSCALSRWCYLTVSCFATLSSSCFQSFPASGSFPVSQFFVSGGQGIGASASTSVLPMNIQGWFPLGLIDLISLKPWNSQQSSLVPQFKGINSSVLSLFYGPTLTFVHDYWKNHSFDYIDLCQQVMSLLFNILPRFFIAFLPKSKHLLLSVACHKWPLLCWSMFSLYILCWEFF